MAQMSGIQLWSPHFVRVVGMLNWFLPTLLWLVVDAICAICLPDWPNFYLFPETITVTAAWFVVIDYFVTVEAKSPFLLALALLQVALLYAFFARRLVLGSLAAPYYYRRTTEGLTIDLVVFSVVHYITYRIVRYLDVDIASMGFLGEATVLMERRLSKFWSRMMKVVLGRNSNAIGASFSESLAQPLLPVSAHDTPQSVSVGVPPSAICEVEKETQEEIPPS